MVYDRILISQQQLQETAERMAKEVSDFYGRTEFAALILLEGATYFAGDLLAKVKAPFTQQAVKISSYHGTTSGETVTLGVTDELRQSLTGKHILVIDDIYDTGKTLAELLTWLRGCNPKSIKTCVLLEKEIPHTRNVTIDFLGLKIPDVFVIGYGMDLDGDYRQLPFIAELSAEKFGPGAS